MCLRIIRWSNYHQHSNKVFWTLFLYNWRADFHFCPETPCRLCAGKKTCHLIMTIHRAIFYFYFFRCRVRWWCSFIFVARADGASWSLSIGIFHRCHVGKEEAGEHRCFRWYSFRFCSTAGEIESTCCHCSPTPFDGEPPTHSNKRWLWLKPY